MAYQFLDNGSYEVSADGTVCGKILLLGTPRRWEVRPDCTCWIALHDGRMFRVRRAEIYYLAKWNPAAKAAVDLALHQPHKPTESALLGFHSLLHRSGEPRRPEIKEPDDGTT